jgi:hypothetical protein
VAEQQVVACWELEHDAWWASEEHPRRCGEQGMAKRVGWAADLVSRLAGVTDHEEQHWARGSTLHAHASPPRWADPPSETTSAMGSLS